MLAKRMVLDGMGGAFGGAGQQRHAEWGALPSDAGGQTLRAVTKSRR